MKSPLRKLRELAAVHHREDPKEQRRRKPRSQGDELAEASQDLRDMRDCCDNFLSAAATALNSSYEFSEALKELGTCLLQKTALSDDEETGMVLLKIGKAQFELQKLVNNYRSHISRTITIPSESLLNEIQIVEEMKQKCDEKRAILGYMLASNKEKGRPRNTKGKHNLPQQLRQAHEAYDEEADLFIFRLRSLKQGQSRSLLTQAARHHAAQLNFFQKGSALLEAVEPAIKLIAEQQCIDYKFSGLEDDVTDGGDDCSFEANNDSDLSFDYEQNEQGPEVDSTSHSSMELDRRDNSLITNAEILMGNLDKKQHAFFSLDKMPRPGSYSAPIFSERKIDFAEKLKEFEPSKKFYSYALPIPTDSKSSKLPLSDTVHVSQSAIILEKPTRLQNSSPLLMEKNGRKSEDGQGFSSPYSPSEAKSVPEIKIEPVLIAPPLAEMLSLPNCTVDINPNTKKMKRQNFSAPLTKKVLPSKAISSPPQNDHLSMTHAVPVDRFTRQHSSRNTNLGITQPLTTSPIISELHELPRPPLSSSRSTRLSSGYSTPLASIGPENFTARRFPAVPQKASPLPVPPGSIPRSFSIPSSSRMTALSAAPRFSEAERSDMDRGVVSPSLSPMVSIKFQPAGVNLEHNDLNVR